MGHVSIEKTDQAFTDSCTLNLWRCLIFIRVSSLQGRQASVGLIDDLQQCHPFSSVKLLLIPQRFQVVIHFGLLDPGHGSAFNVSTIHHVKSDTSCTTEPSHLRCRLAWNQGRTRPGSINSFANTTSSARCHARVNNGCMSTWREPANNSAISRFMAMVNRDNTALLSRSWVVNST